MTIQVVTYNTGQDLAEVLTAFYPSITGAYIGVTKGNSTNDVILGNPTSEFAKNYQFTFDDGTSIEAVGMHDFVAAFVDSVASGKTLAAPLESLKRQLPISGQYSTWTITYDDGL